MHVRPSRTTSRSTATAVAVASVGAMLLASCSSAAPSATGSTGTSCETATRELKMAFVYATTSQNPFQEMALGAQAAADADGKVNLVLSAPPAIDPPKQVSMFQAAAQTAKDGIAYQTVAPEPFGNALRQAAAQGISIAAVDAPAPQGAEDAVPLFVGNSNTTLGELLGQAYLKQNPPTGEVVLGNDIPSLQLLVQRLQGVQNALKGQPAVSSLSGPFDSGAEKAINFTKWSDLVRSHPNAVAYIGVGSADGENLPLIKKQSGREFLIGSADISPESLGNVKNGSVFALSSPEHWMKGYIAMNQLIKSKRTCSPLPTGWWDSGNLLVDSSNVDAIIARQTDAASRTAWFKPEIDKQLANPPIKAMSALN